jgi:hypothetical protein
VVPPDTLIWDLSHWIPLFSLIIMVPIIFKPFFFHGPTPLPNTLIFHLSHWIPLFPLIIVVYITYQPFFSVDPLPLPGTPTSQMATTHNQDLQAKTKQNKENIQKLTSEIASINSKFEIFRTKSGTNLTPSITNSREKFDTIKSTLNQLLNQSQGPPFSEPTITLRWC